MKIARVNLYKLWGRYDVTWNLNEGANILTGINGSGKTTLFDMVVCLSKRGVMHSYYQSKVEKVIIEYSDGTELIYEEGRVDITKGGKSVDLNILTATISSFDVTLEDKDAYINRLIKASWENKRSEMDFLLGDILNSYARYLARITQQVEEKLAKGDVKDLQDLFRRKNDFLDIVDSFFKDTHKKVNRKNSVLEFFIADNPDEKISTKELSSGEKQLLCILLLMLISDWEEYVIFMDEPEISLHIDWQRKLIGTLLKLNPNAQLIIATHSPSMIYEGWEKAVVNMEDILIKSTK